ncbi:hypothetical protein [Burkholderia sp. Ac-20353]|uniref:hypothetical protein n=1 Tax=Burkholderia sp. Ac-20353 TaxID=2703894 RepID=UPI00197C3789|nr:hypothetical protein [Burkholderia sp. Ac-20353]MBN3790046.1 response regulator [Burkholderia sp. Ac-20353]
MIIFPKPKSLHDFELSYKKSVALRNVNELRQEVEIVAIDDQPFAAETNLKNSGFKITVLRDIQRVNEVDHYSIILCDINGIGLALSQETQGAYVIEEIKKVFPEKIVIAYTAGSPVSKLVQRARAVADGYLKKDASIEEWRDELDMRIKALADPIATWKNLRLRLLKADIELKDLLELEDTFIKAFPKGVKETRDQLNSKLSGKSAHQWKGELAKFLGSKAFEFAFSALVESSLKQITA